MPQRNVKQETNKTSKMEKATKAVQEEAPKEEVKMSALQKKVYSFLEKHGHKDKVEDYAERTLKLDGQSTPAAFIKFEDGRVTAGAALYDLMTEGDSMKGYSVEIAKEEEVLIFFKG